MKIGVLGAGDGWYLRDLVRAAADEHEVTSVPFTQLGGDVALDHVRSFSGELVLEHFDGILARAMPPGSLEQVVFRMDLLGAYEARGGVILNPPRAIEVAVDKYLALTKLHGAGLLTPATLVCQTADQAMKGFEALGGDVVIKPLFGSEGRGIARLNDDALALRAFTMLEQLGAVIYLQEFIAHEGFDLRLLVIGSRILAMKRVNPLDWRTNVSRGARGEAFEPDDALVAMARRSAEAVGATLAGVDLIPARDGKVYVVEVNAAPGWRGLGKALNIDIAKLVLEHLCECIRERQR